MSIPADEQLQLFHEIVARFPNPLFVVDEDVRIRACNQAAENFTGANPRTMLRKRGGEVLRCMHSTATEDGCGHSSSCADCIIRGSVGRAFENAETQRKRARMELVGEDGDVQERFMLVTTSPLKMGEEQLAMLILEDITDMVLLKDLLPICAGCKKIRDDQNYWREVENYIGTRLDVEFTHGLCPDCVEKYYPDYKKDDGKQG